MIKPFILKKKNSFATRFVLYLNYVFAIALLLAYFAPYISPDSSLWFIAVFGLAYPFIFIANILFIIYWSIRTKIYLLLSLFLILIGFGNIGKYYQQSSKNKDIDPQSYKLLSYNNTHIDYICQCDISIQ